METVVTEGSDPALGRTHEAAGALTYAIITPARNEAALIEQTIRSVIAQTVRPVRWVIVSDGSTDGTDEIVARYAAEHDWIELLRMPERRERHFAGKVLAFKAGYARLKGLQFACICSLDADVTFEEDYFAFLLERMASDPKFGVVGTPFREGNETYDYRFVSVEHVSGACQLFRRECFEDIGGYVPNEAGGIDHIAVLTARMRGWKTRSFLEKTCEHHRKQGSAKRNSVMAKYHVGKLDYLLGAHPAWEVFRSVYQMQKRPWLLGGIMIFAGYFGNWFARRQRAISPELVAFRRREQMDRLGFILRRGLHTEARSK